ncbi:MAG: WG repeat-containing protein [Bacteroidales bacterium]|nr:WG repeat-containing protein [Bacteroidales bacterium]
MRKSILLLSLLICSAFSYGQELTSFQDKETEKFGFVDNAGNVIITPIYNEVISEFHDGVAMVADGAGYYFIDATGKTKGNKYDFASDFNEFGISQVVSGGKLDKESGEKSGGKIGFVNISGKVVISPRYIVCGEFNSNGIAWVNAGGKYNDNGVLEGGKFGFINLKGEEIVSPKYDFIGDFGDKGYCWVNKGGEVFVSEDAIDARVNEYAKTETDPDKIAEYKNLWVNSYTAGKIDVMRRKIYKGKYGFIDADGNILIDVKYAAIGNEFIDGAIWATTSKKKIGKYGYLSSTGEALTDFKYSMAYDFSCGFGMVGVMDGFSMLVGFVDKYGKEVVPLEYTRVSGFIGDDPLTAVCFVKNREVKVKRRVTVPSKWGVINASGKLLTECRYDEWNKDCRENGIFAFKLDGKWGYVDSKGKEVTDFVFDEVNPFHGKTALVKKEDKFGFVDFTGDFIHPMEFTEVSYANGLYAANSPVGGTYIDDDGNIVIPFGRFSSVSPFFDNGMAAVKSLGGKIGYIDMEGNIIVDCRYDEASLGFKEGVAAVRVGNMWGGIDETGRAVIPFAFDSISDCFDFVDGYYLLNNSRKEVMDERDVTIYRKRLLNKATHHAISAKILNDYWDF